MRKSFRILQANEIGMSITSSNAIFPAASVSGLFFAHPESHYFSVGRISKEQVEDYSLRKGVSVQEIEELIQENLGYFGNE